LSLVWQYSLQGVLQGAQNFAWLGVIAIGSGLGRLVMVWIFVVLLGQGVSGALAGVFGAALGCALLATWRTWPVLSRPRGDSNWLGLGRRCVWLIAGMGSLSLLLSLDQIASRRFLPPEQMDLYAAAGTIGRVVVLITVPLTVVMFPKVARSIAAATRPAAFFQALLMVGLVGGAAAVMCTLFPALPIRLLQGPRYLEAAALVPVFAWSVLPLTLATVLANNLFARGCYGIIPVLVVLTIGYHLYLESHHGDARQIIQALFMFSSAACVCCALACWRVGRKTRPSLVAIAEAGR
jgi:O-antigen/teichoic acid export membrane protein